MTEAGWYFAEHGQQVGPVTREELGQHVRAGRITASSQVWRQGMGGWLPLGQSELASLLAPGSPPPPLPPGYGPGSVPPAATASFGQTSLPGASFGTAFSRFWSGYVTFSGRASRSEYWFAMLGVFLLSLAALVLDAVLFGSSPTDGVAVFSTILNLAVFLPSLAIGSRRLHDIDRSAWWMLIAFVPLVGAIVLLVFCCIKGTEGPNRFGI